MTYIGGMPRKSKLNLMPVDFDKESLGGRLARIRKERGLTQNQVAARTGLTQVLISDYERGRLRLTADMVVRFAVALEITTDELLRPPHKSPAPPKRQPSLRLMRRIEQIESLPVYEQRALLTTIDQFIAAAQHG